MTRYGVVNRTHREDDGTEIGIVSEDELVEPFDSLFEQRVYNRIVDRGYTVHAQYSEQGYNIDMVIIGAKGKLAVECDGDFWHGPAAYEADLARQRELERCGWEFFRIRESMFYADMAGSLRKLWGTLDELDIRTANWIDPSFDEDVADETGEVIEEVVIDDQSLMPETIRANQSRPLTKMRLMQTSLRFLAITTTMTTLLLTLRTRIMLLRSNFRYRTFQSFSRIPRLMSRCPA